MPHCRSVGTHHKGKNIGIRMLYSQLSPKCLGQCTASLILRLRRSLTTIRWDYLLLHFTGLLWLSNEWCTWRCNLRTHKVLSIQELPDQQDLTRGCLVLDTRTPDNLIRICLMLMVWDTCYIFIIPVSIKNYRWLGENIDFSGGVYMHTFFSH